MHNNSWCWRDFFLPFSFTFRSKCWLECLFSSRRTQRMEMNQFSRFFLLLCDLLSRKIQEKSKIFAEKFDFFSSFWTTDDDVDDHDDDEENKGKVSREWWKYFNRKRTENCCRKFSGGCETASLKNFHQKKFPFLGKRKNFNLDEMKTRWNCLRLKLE